MSTSDRDLFETLLKRRYPSTTFDETAMQHIYRGWWLHKTYADRRIQLLEKRIASQSEQLNQLLEKAR